MYKYVYFFLHQIFGMGNVDFQKKAHYLFLCALSVSYFLRVPSAYFGLEQKSKSWKMNIMHANSCYLPYATSVSPIFLTLIASKWFRQI